jgi:chaperone required for assembly of F1-ATPase
VKRFYKEVAVSPDGGILLDGRPVRTPARELLSLPTPALADAVVAEWSAQGEEIDPKTMPLTGLANAAIDRVAPDPAAFARPLAAFAETDLLCYRADTPPELVAAEQAAWDPLLDWARRRYDVHFAIASGIVHLPQPTVTISRLGEALLTRDAFALAAFYPLVTIGGSVVAALAVAEGAIDPAAAFELTHLDELWQAEHWGEDWLATDTREARKRDFLAAAHFLGLL